MREQTPVRRASEGPDATSVKVQVFINGKFAKEGRLAQGGTTLSLIGLPKGTFKVAFVASTASGKTYEDTRTFHTCIPKINARNTSAAEPRRRRPRDRGGAPGAGPSRT